MARARSSLWLAVPMALAAGAALWLVLSAPGSGPGADPGSGPRGRDDGTPPETAGGPGGGTLAKGTPARTKRAAMDDEAAPAAFAKADGVFGRVRDSHEKPIPAAKVSLWAPGAAQPWGTPDPAPLATATAGPDGTFLVGPAPAGRLKVRGDAPGFAGTIAWVASKGAYVDLVLDRGGSLRVKVRDGAGAAVAGAEVRVFTGAGLAAASTSAAGEATLDALSAGQGTLIVSAAGFSPLTVGDVVVEAGKTVERECVVGKGIPVTGRVIDEASGAAIEGAEVTLAPSWDPTARPVAPVKTDADGRFLVESAGGANAWMTVSASKEGYAAASTGVRLQAMGTGGGQEVVLKMSRGSSAGASGAVLDADGRVVAGATVVYANMARTAAGAEAPTTTSDAEGRFALDLPLGTGKEWNLTVAAVARGKGLGAAQASAAKREGITIRLVGAGSVLGKVTGPAGEPIEGATVALTFDAGGRVPAGSGSEMQPWMLQPLFFDPRLGGSPAASTDATGSFRIDDVPAGSYRAEATWGLEHAASAEVVAVRAGAAETVSLSMGTGKTIEGRVVDGSGTAVAGAYVNGWDPDNRTPRENRSASTRTDADGAFALRNATGDRWQLSVFATGYAPQTVQGVAVGDKGVEVRLVSLGWIDGVVLADGQPYAGTFTASVQPAGSSSGNEVSNGVRYVREISFSGSGGAMYDNGGSGREQSFSSADGTFRLRGVAAGPWKLNITTPDGWIPAAPVEVAVSHGAGSGPVQVRLVRGASIEGVLREDVSAQPVAGGQVNLRIKGAPETGGLQFAWSTTDAKGRYAASGLAGGTYVLNVTTPAGLSIEDEIRLSAGQSVQHDIVALRFGSVLVKVVDGQGRPVANAQVNLTTDRGTWIQPNFDLLRRENRIDTSRPNAWQRVTQTDESGVNQRWHVPPGRVIVQVRAPAKGLSSDPVPADVASDRVTEVTVTVNETGAPTTPK